MNILLIGGVIFLGRALANAPQARGHTITLLNRGQTNPGAHSHTVTIYNGRTLIIRPGLFLGPFDTSDCCTFWLA